MLDLGGGSGENGARVRYYLPIQTTLHGADQLIPQVQFWDLIPSAGSMKWRLIPVRVGGVNATLEETFDLDLPPRDEDEPKQSPAHD